jgi:hypothetical protein
MKRMWGVGLKGQKKNAMMTTTSKVPGKRGSLPELMMTDLLV